MNDDPKLPVKRVYVAWSRRRRCLLGTLKEAINLADTPA